MYSAAFIYQPGEYDAEFHRLNALIDELALSIAGYLGQESWRSTDGSRMNATYYWETLESLRAFSTHPQHLEAKRQYGRWYHGFQVVISEVIRSYGDGGLAHLTAHSRARGVQPKEKP